MRCLISKMLQLLLVLTSTVLPASAVTFAGKNFDEATLNQRVGAVVGKCCRAGRRWGCDPGNFNQSGCKPIVGSILNCRSMNWVMMRCDGADCLTSNPEHLCEVDIETVARNRCKPTGRRTTAGCPEDYWQCQVLKRDYTTPSSPTVDVLVCDLEVSTLCATNYSHCD